MASWPDQENMWNEASNSLKTSKMYFFSFFFKLNLINELYIAPGPQKGILLCGFIRGQMVLQCRPRCLMK